MSCNICLEDENKEDENETIEHFVFVCGCKLSLHKSCLEIWNSYEKDTCPMCREKFIRQSLTTNIQDSRRIYPEQTIHALQIHEPVLLIVNRRFDEEAEINRRTIEQSRKNLFCCMTLFIFGSMFAVIIILLI